MSMYDEAAGTFRAWAIRTTIRGGYDHEDLYYRRYSPLLATPLAGRHMQETLAPGALAGLGVYQSSVVVVSAVPECADAWVTVHVLPDGTQVAHLYLTKIAAQAGTDPLSAWRSNVPGVTSHVVPVAIFAEVDW